MREYGPEGFWWDKMLRAGERPVPGFAQEPPAPPLELPPAREVGAVICMRHRKRVQDCGCHKGGY